MKKNPAKSNWEAWFEALQVRELPRLPTSAWESMAALWQMLHKLDPSTRCRLLFHMLSLCNDRGDAPPRQLVDWIGQELKVKKTPRDRVRDQSKLQEAALFQARNPGASLSEIAAAVGIPGKKTTIRSFRENPEFQNWHSDEQFLLKLEQEKAALASGPPHGELSRSSKQKMLNAR